MHIDVTAGRRPHAGRLARRNQVGSVVRKLVPGKCKAMNTTPFIPIREMGKSIGLAAQRAYVMTSPSATLSCAASAVSISTKRSGSRSKSEGLLQVMEYQEFIKRFGYDETLIKWRFELAMEQPKHLVATCEKIDILGEKGVRS
jgi:hypothetical protein